LGPVAGFEDLVAADLDHFADEDEDAVCLDAGIGAEVGDGVVADDEVFNEGDADGSIGVEVPALTVPTELNEPVVGLAPAAGAAPESPVFWAALAVPKALREAVSRSNTLVMVFEVMVRFSMEMISKIVLRSKKPTGPMPHRPHAEDAVVIDEDVDEGAAGDGRTSRVPGLGGT
jgi:hypothetical protein